MRTKNQIIQEYAMGLLTPGEEELNKVIAKVKLLSNLLNTNTQWEQDLELELE